MTAPRQERRSFKIIIVGDPAVGKTSIMEQYIFERFTALYKPTIGTDFMTKELLLDGTLVKLQIWDTAGQETWCNQMGVAYYRGSDGCVFVYDVTNLQSLQNVQKWHDSFTQHISIGPTFPLFLVGNKSDAAGRDVSAAQARELAAQLQIPPEHVHDVSAKTGDGVAALFQQVAAQCMCRRGEAAAEEAENFVLQRAEEEPERGRRGCC